MQDQAKGILVASAVAAILVACSQSSRVTNTPPTAAEMSGKVKCTGINECRAKGVCAQVGHQCGGQNECRGKGVTLVSADDCATRGGTKM